MKFTFDQNQCISKSFAEELRHDVVLTMANATCPKRGQFENAAIGVITSGAPMSVVSNLITDNSVFGRCGSPSDEFSFAMKIIPIFSSQPGTVVLFELGEQNSPQISNGFLLASVVDFNGDTFFASIRYRNDMMYIATSHSNTDECNYLNNMLRNASSQSQQLSEFFVSVSYKLVPTTESSTGFRESVEYFFSNKETHARCNISGVIVNQTDLCLIPSSSAHILQIGATNNAFATSFHGEFKQFFFFNASLNEPSLLRLVQDTKLNALPVSPTEWKVSIPQGGGGLNLTHLPFYDDDLDPLVMLKIVPSTTLGSVFLFGERLTGTRFIPKNQTSGLTYIPTSINSFSVQGNQPCNVVFDSFRVFVSDSTCLDNNCYVGDGTLVSICLFRPGPIWIEVSQGSNQSISLPFPLYSIAYLPNKGRLFVTHTSAPLTSSMTNLTFGTNELSFDVQNSTAFSWVLPGECRGEYTSFGIYVSDVFREVIVCVRNIFDLPLVLPIDMGDIAINDFRIVRLDVFSREDFLVDALGNPSPFRTRLNPVDFVSSASIRFPGVVENDLFYLTSAATPTRCGDVKIGTTLFPMLFNGEEMFFVCIHIKPTVLVGTNFKPKGNITFLYVDKNGASLEQNITFRAVVPYFSRDAEFVFPQSVNATHDITLSASVTLDEFNSVIQFKIHTLPLHGTLLFLNGSVVASGSITPNKQFVYVPNPHYFSRLVGDIGDPDWFSFSIGGVPFNNSYSSPIYRCNIYIESEPDFKTSLVVPSFVHLVRDKSVPLGGVYWNDVYNGRYDIAVSVSLIKELAGRLDYVIPDQVNVRERTQSSVVVWGKPPAVQQMFDTLAVYLSTSEYLANTSQRVYVYVHYPVTDQVLNNKSVACETVHLFNLPVEQQPDTTLSIITGLLIFWAVFMLGSISYSIRNVAKIWNKTIKDGYQKVSRG